MHSSMAVQEIWSCNKKARSQLQSTKVNIVLKNSKFSNWQGLK